MGAEFNCSRESCEGCPLEEPTNYLVENPNVPGIFGFDETVELDPITYTDEFIKFSSGKQAEARGLPYYLFYCIRNLIRV
jgi:hypothetical protein